jgi:hypothetical protein
VLTILPPVKDGKDGLNGRDGKDADEDRIKREVLLDVTKALDSIPIPKDGRNGVDGKDGRDGIDGKSAEPVDVGAVIAEVVKMVPIPKDGRDGRDGKDGYNGKDAEAINVADVVEQVVKLIPIPKDGRDGVDAEPVNIEEVVTRAVEKIDMDAIVRKAASKIPPPRDGRDGKDGEPGKDGAPGNDGLSVADIDLSMKADGRTLVVSIGGVRKEIRLDIPIDRDVYVSGKEYQKADGVTYGGSWWIAKVDSPKLPPGSNNPDEWRLAVKRGRDAK